MASTLARLTLPSLCVLTMLGCSPDHGEDESTLSFGAEPEDIKVEIYISAVTQQDPSESGDEALYEVAVNEPPTAPMFLMFQSEDEGEVLSSSVLITPGNWSVPQQVSFVGVDDFVRDGDQDVTITPSLQTLDARYAALVLEEIQLINLDNESDAPGISTTGTTSGGGQGNGQDPGNGGPPPIPGSPTSPYLTFESGELTPVSLSSQVPHTEPIQISITLDDDTEATIVSIDHASDPGRAPDGAASFTLDPEAWPDEWIISLRGLDDAIADGDIPHTLTLTITDPTANGPITQRVHLLSIDGVCGNGVQEGSEGCDDGNLEVDACLYGEECCNVCGPRCFIVEGTPGGLCGDGIIQSGEACDPMAPDVCLSAPFTGGASSCDESCQVLDTSRCTMNEPSQILVSENFMCTHSVDGELLCAGKNGYPPVEQAAPPVSDRVHDIELVPGGGCLIDGQKHTRCWGSVGTFYNYVGTERSIALSFIQDKLCTVEMAGSVVCRDSANGLPYKIIARGITANSRPVDVALGQEGTQHCILFDDESVNCALDHLKDPLQIQPFPAGVKVVEIAVSGRFGCALGDNNVLSCWDGEAAPLLYEDVRAFHIDEQLCTVGTDRTLSCTNSADFFPDFAPSFYGLAPDERVLDVSFRLEDNGFTRGTFCVMREDRSIECWGAWSMHDTLEDVPWRPRDVRVETSHDETFIQDEFGTWRVHGGRFSKRNEETLSMTTALPSQQIVFAGDFPCVLALDGHIECGDIPPSNFTFDDPPYSRIIGSDDGSLFICVVNAQRQLLCDRIAGAGQGLDQMSIALQGASHPAVSLIDNAVCVSGPNQMTSCTGTAPFLAEQPPNFLEKISINNDYACGLRLGQIECWGMPDLDIIQGTYTELATNRIEACAIDTQGAITCWRPQFPTIPSDIIFEGTGYSNLSLSLGRACAIHESGFTVCQGETKQEKP